MTGPFPTPTAWPTSAMFPAPNPDPRIGANPFRGSSEATPTVASLFQPISASTGSAMTAMGIPAESGMTEDAAMQQTQSALAKLASVNPQLAEQLAQQHANAGDEGGGFFGALKSIAGAVFSPALSAGGKILDIIGRTSHIVPQWFDPDDEGSWTEDIGQALSGESKTNWNEVLQNRGVLENAGWLRASVGLFLDIATDPITYATLGAGAGVSTSEKAANAARLVATEGKQVARLAEISGKTLDEASSHLRSAYSLASGQTDSIAAIRKYSEGGMEELLGGLGKATASEVQAVLRDGFDMASQAYKMVYSRTFKSFLNRGGVMTLESGAKVSGKELVPMFNAIAKSANFTKYGAKGAYANGLWNTAKAGAGAMGGLRFRFAVPFTQFRYISPMVPQSWRLGLGFVGRFGAGLSGEKVVAQFGPAAETLFSQYGWTGLHDLARTGSAIVDLGRSGGRQLMAGTPAEQALAKKIVGEGAAGRADYLRSAFYSASERAGNLTAHLSPGARVYRRGLGYYFYREGIKDANRVRANLVDDLAYAIKGDGSGQYTKEELMGRYENVYGKKVVRSGAVTGEDLRDAKLYTDYFGHTAIPRDEAELESWFWKSRPDRAAAKQRFDGAEDVPGFETPGEAEFAVHQATLDDMKRVLASVTGEKRAVLDDFINTGSFAKTTAERHGVEVGDSAMPLDRVRVIHPDDANAGVLGQAPAASSGEFDMELPPNTHAYEVRQGGVTPDMVTVQEEEGILGVGLDLTGGGSADSGVKVVLRDVHNIQEVNVEDLHNIEGVVSATEDTVSSGTARLPELHKAYADAQETAGAEMAEKLHPLFANKILRTEYDAAARAGVITEALRAGINPPDAIRVMRDGKPVKLIVLDSKKVFVVSENASALSPQGGYARRTLSSVLKEKLGGVAVKDGGKFFGDPAQIELSFRRQTRNMTLPEAEKYVREQINSAPISRYGGIKIADGEDVFNWDVLSSHHDYVKAIGDSYFGVATGRITQRMLALGNLVPSQFGAMAKSSRTMFQMPAARMRQLAKAERNVQNTFIKMTQKQATQEERMGKTVVDAHNRVSLALAYLEAGLTGDDIIPAEQLATAMDGVVRSAARLDEVVGDTQARLAKRTAELDQRAATTQAVEDAMHVTEFDDLDSFIQAHAAPTFGSEAEGAIDHGIPVVPYRGKDPFDPTQSAGEEVLDPIAEAQALLEDQKKWAAETKLLTDAKEAGTATSLGDGVWRIDIAPRTMKRAQSFPDAMVGKPPGEFEIPGSRNYVATDETGGVVSTRSVADDGSDVAETAINKRRQGYGGKLIMAHWRDNGVVDFQGIKDAVGPNSLSKDAIPLNKWAARKIMKEQGIHDPETIRDLLDRGELYVGKEGTILTKDGALRKGGTKVHSKDAIEAERADIAAMSVELSDLRRAAQGLPPAAPLAKAADDVVDEAPTIQSVDEMNAELAARDADKPFASTRTALEDAARVASEATLTDGERALSRIEERAAARFGATVTQAQRAEQSVLARSEKAAFKRGEIVQRAQTALTNASNEFNRAQAELNGAWAEMKPAVQFGIPPEGGFAGLRQVQIPGMGGISVHPYMAEEMEYLFRGAVPNHLQREWRKFVLGPWKRWATYRNPGFHVRNNFGAWFNGALGGVDEKDFHFAHKVMMARDGFKEWAHTPVIDEDWARLNFGSVGNFEQLKGKITYGDVSNMMADLGMGRASTTSVALTMGGEALSVGNTAGAVRGAFHKLDRKLRRMGSLTEDFHRTANWAAGMRTTKGDLYGSRAFVMVRQGDYADLTETENWIKDIIPFYKWMRTNVPYQFKMLAENPGLLTALTDKSQTWAYAVQGRDRYEEEARQPEWMRRGYNIPIPEKLGEYLGGADSVTADLPYTDLYNGARDYLSSGLPVIKNLVEAFGIKQSIFTGQELGNKMVPVSGILANPVMAPLIQALPWAQKGADGETYIPDTIDNVLSAHPLYSKFHNWMVSDPVRVSNRTATFTSALLGLGLAKENVTAVEQSFYYDELLPAIENMKSMGYVFPTAQQLHDAGSLITSYGEQPSASEAFPDGVAGMFQPVAA